MSGECHSHHIQTFSYVFDTPFSIYAEMHRQLQQVVSFCLAKTMLGPAAEAALEESIQAKRQIPPLAGFAYPCCEEPTTSWHAGDRFQIQYARLMGRSYGLDQMVNYFKASHVPPICSTILHPLSPQKLTLKAALVRRLVEMSGEQAWGITPRTLILQPEKDDEEQKEAMRAEAAGAGGPWIVKPSHGGKGEGVTVHLLLWLVGQPWEVGISIHESYDTIEDSIGTGKGVWVVQQYIERPLLITGRKFDVRSWVLLSPGFDIYLFSDGAIRTCSEAYNRGQLGNMHSHLTNHCLQLNHPDYGRWEEGNELFYADLDAHIRRASDGRCDFAGTILPQIRSIVIDTLLAVRELIDVSLSSSYTCFQLLGYDFLIDEDFKVWLLEVNGSPASAQKLLVSMVRSMLETVVDARFPPPPGWEPPFEGETMGKFEQIYNGRTGRAVSAA